MSVGTVCLQPHMCTFTYVRAVYGSIKSWNPAAPAIPAVVTGIVSANVIRTGSRSEIFILFDFHI